MRAKLNYIIVIFCITVEISFSQSINDQMLYSDLIENKLLNISGQIKNINLYNKNLEIATNRADIIQLGNNNEAYIEQVKDNEVTGNTGAITQYFDNNQASINQSGKGNYNSVNQSGLGNKMIVAVEGNYNNSVLIQEGNNNFLAQKLDSDFTKYYFSQQGSNNLIIQQESEAVSKPYMIFQKGNGMRLMITSGVIR